MMKKTLLILIAVIVAIGIGGYFAISNLDINGIVKNQIESNGTNIVGRNVSVGAVDIKLKNGNGNINNIAIANNGKYDKFLTIKNINLNIDTNSITKNPKVINNISASGVTAWIFLQKNGKFDIQGLQDSIAKKLQKSKPKQTTEQSTDGGVNYDPNIIVKNVELKDIKIVLDVSKLNGKVYDLTLAKVNIRNVGGKSGKPASQIGGIIINELIGKIAYNAETRAKRILQKKAEEKLKKELEKRGKDLLKKLF